MSRKPTAPPFICSHTFRYKTGTSGESLCVLLKVNSGVFLGFSLTCYNLLPLSCKQWNWKEKTDLDEQLDARLLVRVLPKCHLVPKKSWIHFFFFKVPLRQSSVALHTHPQTNQQICRKRVDLKCCSGSQEAVRSWMSAERECDTSQGCLGSVRGLLGGYRSEHTFTSQGREGGSRDDGRGARSFIPGAKLNEERA